MTAKNRSRVVERLPRTLEAKNEKYQPEIKKQYKEVRERVLTVTDNYSKMKTICYFQPLIP